MGNIEQLKKEVGEFKAQLDALKNNVSISEAEKKNKAETLKNQAEITKKKIEKEISELAEKTDNVSKKQKEEAEALLKSFEDTVNLQMSILNPSEKPKETTTPSSENTAKEEK
jgi:undecaprenyl pyrophosphate synthase